MGEIPENVHQMRSSCVIFEKKSTLPYQFGKKGLKINKKVRKCVFWLFLQIYVWSDSRLFCVKLALLKSCLRNQIEFLHVCKQCKMDKMGR